MDFSEQFDILAPNDIRIRGTRVGIETVVDEFLRGSTAEAIATKHPSLTLSNVYATIAYYYDHREEVDDYLAKWRRDTELASKEQDRHPSAAVARLRALKHRGTNGSAIHD